MDPRARSKDAGAQLAQTQRSGGAVACPDDAVLESVRSGTASEVEKSRVVAHLQECVPCRERSARMDRPGSVSATVRADAAHTPISDLTSAPPTAPPVDAIRLGR